MSTGRRIVNVLSGLLLIALAVVMMVYPEQGFSIIAGILTTALTVYGIRYLVYYFTMARYMVGGKLILCIATIVLDIGAFTATQLNAKRVYIILYLLGAHAFSGVIDIMRGLEAKSYGGASWRINVGHGVINIIVAFTCVIFLRSTGVLVFIYAAGLIYSSLMLIASALRRTAIVYIQ